MLDAVRPDEYRQRFGAARDLAHPNVAATYEVLDVNGRPAVVQEWLHGLPGGDWPSRCSRRCTTPSPAGAACSRISSRRCGVNAPR